MLGAWFSTCEERERWNRSKEVRMGKPIFVLESDEVMNLEGHEGVAQVEWRVRRVVENL